MAFRFGPKDVVWHDEQGRPVWRAKLGTASALVENNKIVDKMNKLLKKEDFKFL
jgi:hypothetical protein